MFVSGPAAAVTAAVEVARNAGIEDVISVNLAFESGVVGSLVSVWHEMLERISNRNVEVFNETMWARLQGEWFGEVAWTIGDESTSLEGEALVTHAAAVSPGSGENPDGNFIRAVERGETAEPSLRTALRAHVVVDACYRSAETGERVEVDPGYGRAHG